MDFRLTKRRSHSSGEKTRNWTTENHFPRS